MVLLQLIGQGAFIVASIALGTKLLLLWRRTGEVPELTLGLSFVVGGGLGYLAWFALAVVGAQGGGIAAFHSVALFGLACTCAGAICNGIGVARIYRADARWPLIGVGAIAIGMTLAWLDYWNVPIGTTTNSFWVAILLATPIYAWGAYEAIALASTLHKRAKLGMADPVVVNRLAWWGGAAITTVAMFAVSFGSRMTHGPMPPAWVAVVNALLGLVAALGIWLAFFPPRRLRERLMRAYGA
jgi:hypothetical protein